MTSSLSDDDLKRAWQWLKVTTPYRQMLANPPQKTILIAIARNLKKKRKTMYPLEKDVFDLIKRTGNIMMHRIGEILDAPMDEVRHACNKLAESNDIVIQDGIDGEDKPCKVC